MVITSYDRAQLDSNRMISVYSKPVLAWDEGEWGSVPEAFEYEAALVCLYDLHATETPMEFVIKFGSLEECQQAQEYLHDLRNAAIIPAATAYNALKMFYGIPSTRLTDTPPDFFPDSDELDDTPETVDDL